jgi:hypothetical protein
MISAVVTTEIDGWTEEKTGARQFLILLPFAPMQKQQKNAAHVPKFGNWDNDGNVPYTVYFDNARKGKGGKPMNPNDPVENPEAFSSSYAAPSPRRSGPEHARAPANLPPPSPPPAHRQERRPSDAQPPPMSPSPYGGASPYRGNAGGEQPRRGAAGGGRASGGYSVEQSPSPSPLHPYSQSRAADYSVEGSPYGLVANSVDRPPNRARGTSRGNETVIKHLLCYFAWCARLVSYLWFLVRISIDGSRRGARRCPSSGTGTPTRRRRTATRTSSTR